MADSAQCDDSGPAARASCRLNGLIAASRHVRVHRATCGDRAVVLKVASAATLADPVGRARFIREGRVGLGMRHPGLVETVDCGDGWIVFQDLGGAPHAPAPDLHVLARGNRSLRLRAACRLDAVAEALAHLHARGLVHRDVKPGNVLIAADGRPVLIDLGVVGFAAGDELEGHEIVGSPAWMAPEQVHGCPPHASADVWSFSLTLAYALCGTPAFVGTADAVLGARRAGAGPCPDFTHALAAVADPATRDLIAAGLSEDPGGRPPITAFARPRKS